MSSKFTRFGLLFDVSILVLRLRTRLEGRGDPGGPETSPVLHFHSLRFEDRKRLLITCLAEATGRRGRKSTVSSNEAYRFHMVLIHYENLVR
ncbi:unnamed protein product [Lactuca virosa]|uniref:Secreted protein n=1 Tax=Lactuca virosa TaxID=75947 RepID=A0AAU9NYB7_9ASTR|nr:unnamed protein product [Lactuca virosa]